VFPWYVHSLFFDMSYVVLTSVQEVVDAIKNLTDEFMAQLDRFPTYMDDGVEKAVVAKIGFEERRDGGVVSMIFHLRINDDYTRVHGLPRDLFSTTEVRVQEDAFDAYVKAYPAAYEYYSSRELIDG